MHLIDHGRSLIEKTYKRPFSDRFVRNLLSKILPYPFRFKIIGMLTLFIKPISFIFPKKFREMIKLMPLNFPKKKIRKMKVYLA